jgi:plasmid stability protein
MPDMLIRGLQGRTLNRLKARAKQNNRSLQSEVKRVLEQAAGPTSEEIKAMFDRWDKQFAGRRFSDSAEMIREDRQR